MFSIAIQVFAVCLAMITVTDQYLGTGNYKLWSLSVMNLFFFVLLSDWMFIC